MKKGFMAYEEIRKSANEVFRGKVVDVIASIFGDDYLIKVNGVEMIKGTSADVADRLEQIKVGSL